jgi:hypothetical protein
LMLIVVGVGFYVLMVIWETMRRSPAITFRDYVEDDFYGIHWGWQWDYDGTLIRRSLRPYCPACKRDLSFTIFIDGSSIDMPCICGKVFSLPAVSLDRLNDWLTREIDVNIRTRKFVSIVEKQRAQISPPTGDKRASDMSM